MSLTGSQGRNNHSPGRIGLSSSIPNKPRGVEKRLAALERHCTPRGAKLLEIGCGNADYAIALRDRFESVTAVDVQYNELPTVVARNVPAAQMSATQMGFPSDAFDIVLAIEVMEHVDSVEDVLREVHRVTRPGGIFFLTSPNRRFPLETHSVTVFGHQMSGMRLPFLPYIPALHDRISEARNFTAAELRTLTSAVGFQEVAVDYVMPPFDHWGVGRRFAGPVTDWIERSRIRSLGMSVAGVYRKGMGWRESRDPVNHYSLTQSRRGI